MVGLPNIQQKKLKIFLIMIMPMQTKSQRDQSGQPEDKYLKEPMRAQSKLLKRGKTRVTNLPVVVAIHLIGWDGCTSDRDQYMISAFFVIKGKKWEDDKYCNVRNNRRDNHDKKLRLLLSQIYMVTDNECLRGRDCKYWESLARLKKTRILIICLENPF